jgi:hypothetical protein
MSYNSADAVAVAVARECAAPSAIDAVDAANAVATSAAAPVAAPARALAAVLVAGWRTVDAPTATGQLCSISPPPSRLADNLIL